MSAVLVYAAAGIGLFALGLHGALFRPSLLHRVLGLNVMGSGVFLVLVASARRAPEGPPDPVPHALVLTGLVIAVSATAFVLGLSRRLEQLRSGADPRNPSHARG